MWKPQKIYDQLQEDYAVNDGSGHLNCVLDVIDLHLNKLYLIQIMNGAHHIEVTFARNLTSGSMFIQDGVPHLNGDQMQALMSTDVL